MVSENKVIEWICNTPAMTIEKPLSPEEQKIYDEKKKSKWNCYNLIPSRSEGYKLYEEVEYYFKMLCYQVAAGVPSEADRIYERRSLLDLYEKLMNQKAYNW